MITKQTKIQNMFFNIHSDFGLRFHLAIQGCLMEVRKIIKLLLSD